MACGEFALIARYFNHTTRSRRDVNVGIGDDCALVNVTEKKTLAISTDTLVEGIHFLPNIAPADLGYKGLAVNLSDLAAMGAEPAWLTLALTLPEVDENWLAAFSGSLFALADAFNMQLIGGDTTRGPRSLTLSVYGYVSVDDALKRSGAQVGDRIYVTGTLGDSAAGLALLQKRLQSADPLAVDTLIQRHLRPQPRIRQGLALRGLASAAIDISDGLIADLGHILAASGCGARLDVSALPLSPALLKHVDANEALQFALTGGEDYELCFTLPENHCGVLEMEQAFAEVPCRCIGQIVPASEGLTLWQGKSRFTVNGKGFDHFEC